MKKYFNIILAIALILLGLLGYRHNRPRPLSACFPAGTWEEVTVSSFSPVPGDVAKGYQLDMTAEELQEAVQDVTVFRRPKATGWTCGNIALRITIGENVILAEIGEDGTISLCNAKTPDTWSYWRAVDGKFYQNII